MSRCFTWFPIGGYRRTQYIPEFGVIYKNMGIFLGGCLTCEELVGDKFLDRFMTNYFT